MDVNIVSFEWSEKYKQGKEIGEWTNCCNLATAEIIQIWYFVMLPHLHSQKKQYQLLIWQNDEICLILDPARFLWMENNQNDENSVSGSRQWNNHMNENDIVQKCAY